MMQFTTQPCHRTIKLASLLAAAILGAALVGLSTLLGGGYAAAQPCPNPDSSLASGWAGGSGNLQQHWLKHRNENSDWMPEDNANSTRALNSYAAQAVNLSPTDTHTLVASGSNRGRILNWDNNNGIFVVKTADGKVISMFKPSRGKAYYDDQVSKDKGEFRSNSTNDNDSDVYTIYTSAPSC